MSWKKVDMEEKRKELIDLIGGNKHSISEICRRLGVSRPTAYKWLNRFEELGIEGLKNRSCAPKNQTNMTPSHIEDEIISIKLTYPCLGPKKIKAILHREMPFISWPSTTTIGNILSRNALIIPRKVRTRMAERASSLIKCQQSNDTWCVDFKGWFFTKDREKCSPLTLTDAFSRYLFTSIQLKQNTFEHVWGIFDRCFREFGLPLRVRSDNGPPFASLCPGRLSRLSINLIKAGVLPEWIDPGEPQQNGQHERMHLTLKQEAILPEELTLAEQQMKFNEFCDYYNYIRPHEALNQKTPGDLYVPSTRLWTGKLKSPIYPDNYEIRKVASCGKIGWKHSTVYISTVLEGEPIGIYKNEEGVPSVYYGPVFLGKIEGKELHTERRKLRERRRYRLKIGEEVSNNGIV